MYALHPVGAKLRVARGAHTRDSEGFPAAFVLGRASNDQEVASSNRLSVCGPVPRLPHAERVRYKIAQAPMADYRSAARKLAAAHKREDPQTAEIYLIPHSHLVDVRLLEVSGSAPSSGDVLPFHFQARPDLGIDFASTVILLSPDEWREVQAGNLRLPSDWDLAKKEPL